MAILMRVEDVDPSEREELTADLGDLRHDLGRYIGFESRMCGPDTLRAALTRDLHATREHHGRTESCWEIWARLRPAVLDDDPDVRAIDRALERLKIDLNVADDDALREAKAQADAVTAATKRLHARALAG